MYCQWSRYVSFTEPLPLARLLNHELADLELMLGLSTLLKWGVDTINTNYPVAFSF